jgi:carotenoid cleavage dioxygenase-like enzyme
MANKFLEGNFAPISQEHTITELEVTGSIPAHLDGRYLRNGPNPLSEVDPATYHWFMGDGMVHGVRIRDGKAEWYRNRWVRNPKIAEALGEKRPSGGRHAAGFDAVGANTNVISHTGKTLALIEGGVANYELTDELDTVGPCDFDGTLPGGYTAHPKRDPHTGELGAVSYFFGRRNRVQYSAIGVDGRARRTVDVQVTGLPMMHDSSLTEKHVLFYDLPVIFDAGTGATATVPVFLRVPVPAGAGEARRLRVRGQSSGTGPDHRDDRQAPRLELAHALPLGPEISGKGRRHAEGRRRRRRPVVRRRAVLRLPPAQRLRRWRRDRARCRPSPPHVRHRSARAQRRRPDA